MQDHYKVLGLNSAATEEEISRAFRQKMKLWHPDSWPESRKAEAEELVKKITVAYTVLSDPKQRAEFDGGRMAPPAAPGAGHLRVCHRCGDHSRPDEFRRLDGHEYCDTCFWALVMERRERKQAEERKQYEQRRQRRRRQSSGG